MSVGGLKIRGFIQGTVASLVLRMRSFGFHKGFYHGHEPFGSFGFSDATAKFGERSNDFGLSC